MNHSFAFNLDFVLQKTLDVLLLNNRTVFVNIWPHSRPFHLYLRVTFLGLDTHLVEATLRLV